MESRIILLLERKEVVKRGENAGRIEEYRVKCWVVFLHVNFHVA